MSKRSIEQVLRKRIVTYKNSGQRNNFDLVFAIKSSINNFILWDSIDKHDPDSLHLLSYLHKYFVQ